MESKKTRWSWGGRLISYLLIVLFGIALAFLFNQTALEGIVVTSKKFRLKEHVVIAKKFFLKLPSLESDSRGSIDAIKNDLERREKAVEEAKIRIDECKDFLKVGYSEYETKKKGFDALEEKITFKYEKEKKIYQKKKASKKKKKIGELIAILDEQAQRNHIFFHAPKGSEKKSPEAWINAYRLAIYGKLHPQLEEDERRWLDGLSKTWKTFLKKLENKKPDWKDLEKKKKDIDKKRKILDQYEKRLAELEESHKAWREALRNRENVLDGVKNKLEKAFEEGKERSKILNTLTPEGGIMMLPCSANGTFRLDKWDLRQYPPGEYEVWMEIYQGGETYWLIQKFFIQENYMTKLILKESAFFNKKYLFQSN